VQVHVERKAADPALAADGQTAVAWEAQGSGEDGDSTLAHAAKEEACADCDELRAQLASLEESQGYLERLLSDGRIAALGLDRDLRLLYFSKAVGELCNLLPGDRGRRLTDFSKDRIGGSLADDANAILDGRSPRPRELRLSDGRWWLRQMLPSRDAGGGIDGIIVSYADINESKEMAEAAASAQRRMAETLEERVQARTAQLRALATELSLSEERERRALARDLHDDLGQVLAIIKIKLSSMDKNERRGKLRASLKEVEALIDDANRSVRSLMMQLSPPVLQTLGISAALEWLAEEMERVYGIAVRIDDDGHDKPLSEPARTSLFRAVRELLINVAKHSGVAFAEVCCLRQDDRITVSVTDHGAGFDYPATMNAAPAQRSFGLLSVRERIEFLGGEVNADSAPGDGATITLTLPVDLADANNS
jgi:signal transduction histidine kinase